MNEIERLRTTIQKFEDRKVSVAQLGREVLHAAHSLMDGSDAPLRQALVRLAHRFTSLAERSLHDDVNDEVRGYVDELHAEIVEAGA